MHKFKKALQIGDKEYKRYLYIYIIMIFTAILLGVTLADTPNKEISVKRLEYFDIFYIFILNLVVILRWLVISPLGLTILSIFKFFVHLGKVSIESGIPPIIYYLVSLSHGLGEILVTFILFSFTVKQLYLFFKCIKDKNLKILKNFYISSISYILSRIVIILFISSIFEIIISNFFINLIYK